MPFTSPLGFYYNDASSAEPWDSTEVTHFSNIETTLLYGTVDGKKRSDSSGHYSSFIVQPEASAGLNINEDVNVIPAVYATPTGSIVAEAYGLGEGISLRVKDTNSDDTHQLVITGDSNNFVQISVQNGVAAPDGLNIQAFDMNFNASSGAIAISSPNAVTISSKYTNINVAGPQSLDISGSGSTLYLSTNEALSIGGSSIALNVSDTNDATHQVLVSGDSNGKVHITAETGSDALSLDGPSVSLNASSGGVSINGTGVSAAAGGGSIVFTGSAFTYNTAPVVTDAASVNWLTSANIQGLSSTAACTVSYKHEGSMVHLWYNVNGAGSGTALSFTLPFSAGPVDEKYFPAAVCQNDGTYVQGGVSINGSGGTTVLAFWTQSPNSASYTWTNSSKTRLVQGYLCYPTA
jgi:hypothetical protein